MIRLYHPKSEAVRELEDGDELRLRLLKRAGFKVGELPDKKEEKPVEEEVRLPSTEGEEDEAKAGKEPVMAQHAPVSEGENPFSGLSMKELREVAKKNDIVIPFQVRRKADVAALLHSKLDLVDEDEEGDDEGD